MLAIIEAVAMPPDDNGKQLIQLYSYQREDGGSTVRDANLVLDIVHELTDPLDGEESPIIKGEPPRGTEYQPLWEIFITVAKTHKDISYQKADYRIYSCAASIFLAHFGMHIASTKKLVPSLG